MKISLSKHTYMLGLKTLVFSTAVLMGLLTVLTYMPLKMPLKMFIVLSGSMSPSISTGSVVIAERQLTPFKEGDVITFIRPNNPTEFVTHRIVSIESNGYLTKGDANNTQDLWVVKQEAVWGKVNLAIPYLGYFLSFSKTKLGLMGMVVLPLLLVAATEIMVIIKEVKRLRQVKIKLPDIKLD